MNEIDFIKNSSEKKHDMFRVWGVDEKTGNRILNRQSKFVQAKAAKKLAQERARQEAIDSQIENINNEYEKLKQQAEKKFSLQKGELDLQKDNNLRQEYIQYMKSMKNFSQKYAPVGMGGVAQSIRNRTKIGYENERKNTEDDYSQKLRKIQREYSDYISQQEERYIARLLAAMK